MSKNFFRINRGAWMVPQTAAPSNPKDGDIYYNSTLLQFQFYENGAWKPLGGEGNVEQSLLFSLLSDNGMEEIAFDSFDGIGDSLVREAVNLDLNVSEDRYEPTGNTDVNYWDGWREPDSGINPYTLTQTGGSSSVSNGILTIDKVASNTRYYTRALSGSGSHADDDILVETEFRLLSESAGATTGGKYRTQFTVYIRDGNRYVIIRPARDTNSSGPKELIVTDGSGNPLDNLDAATVFAPSVDWEQFHNYKFYKKGSDLHIYIDNEYVGRISMLDGTSTSARQIEFGGLATSGAFEVEIKYLNFQLLTSALETKVLLNRGTIAFEGDGNPTSATSASTIQDLSSFDYFTEDNWNEWGTSGSATSTAENAGTLQAVRRISTTSGAGFLYSLEEAQYTGLNDILNSTSNVSIQAQIKFSDIDVTSTSAIKTLMVIRGANKEATLAFKRGSSDTEILLQLGYTEGSTARTTFDEGIGSGSPLTIQEDEIVNIELRRIGLSKVQFLVDGKVQQEADFNDLAVASTTTPRFYWGMSGTAGTNITLDYSFVRLTLNEDYPYLPKAPVQEFISTLDVSAREAYVSYSSDGLRWTAPEKVNASGVAELVLQPKALASGYPMARILMSSESTAQLENLAVLFNSSFGAAGLPTKYTKTFTSAELPSEPQDAVLSHGMGVASDEIHVFGGTEYLVETLDWEHVDADSIIIKNAVSGVPYTIQRVGFSFDRSQDNSDRIKVLETPAIDGGKGILEYYQKEVIDLTGSGDFTDGEFKIERINDQVTLTQISSVTFSAQSSPKSAASVVPMWARPASDKTNVFLTSSSADRIWNLRVNTDGSIQFEIVNFDGTLDATTSIISAFSTLTYSVGTN